MGIAASFIVSAVLTYIMGFKDPVDDENTKTEANAGQTAGTASSKEGSKPSAQAASKSDQEVLSPIEGTIVDLAEVPDPAFASGAMGKGIAIEPSTGRVVAPFDGTVTVAFKKKHALAVVSDSGAEILVHVGVDTVKLDGQHFISYIEEGDRVKAGDLLLEFDIEQIKAAGYHTVTPIIVTNSADYNDVIPQASGQVSSKDLLLKIYGS